MVSYGRIKLAAFSTDWIFFYVAPWVTSNSLDFFFNKSSLLAWQTFQFFLK